MKRFSTITGIAIAVLATLSISFPVSAQTDEVMQRLQTVLTQLDTLQKQVLLIQKEYLEIKLSDSGSTNSTSTTDVFQFKKEMGLGETHEDIKKLQQILATDPDIYADGRTTGYFGPLTAEAVLKFQKKFQITGANGHVGPQTLAKLNSLLRSAGVKNTIPPGFLNNAAKVVTQNPIPSESKEYICFNGQTLQVPKSAVQAYLTGSNYKGECKKQSTANSKEIDAIDIDIKGQTSYVSVVYTNGEDEEMTLPFFDEGDIIYELANRLKIKKEDIEELAGFENKSKTKISEIEVVIENKRKARVTVKYEDTSEAFIIKSNDEDDIIEEVAKSLRISKSTVEDLIEFIENKGDVDEIEVTLKKGSAEVEVEFEEGDSDRFILKTDDEDKIIKELANRYDMDEDEIEDITDFRKEKVKVSKVKVVVENDIAQVTVEYSNGDKDTFKINEDDKNDILEELSDKLDMKKKDIEKILSFKDRDNN